MSKKTSKIHARAKKIGAYLTKDAKRPTGGMIYTVSAYRERDRQLGKLGAASGVRRIDPKTGEVIEEISRSKIDQDKRDAAALENARAKAARRRELSRRLPKAH